MPFDPNAAALPGSGIFGLPHSRDDAAIVLVPVPFDATTSYGGGAADGPRIILEASMQVDLFDHQFGRTYERGIHMLPISDDLRDLSRRSRALAEPIIAAGGAGPDDAKSISTVDAACVRVNSFTFDTVSRLLREGKIPGIVGGDHSTPFGAIRACAEHVAASGAGSGGLGILQIDAHMDLRAAYEGFAWSHASIMHNVLTRIPGVSRLVQVGIRDYSEGEREFARDNSKRVAVLFDHDLATRLDAGESFAALCREAIDTLPANVYISFDIDGLDPSLCPSTGTPVPGGLSFNRAAALLEALARSGRRIIGFDLNEVAPPPPPAGSDADQSEPQAGFDANVGARILYKLCGAAAASRK